ncbi:MAG TPA: creatininase family protein [Pirellulaceae bacterium]|nr:creatininase family protein [Pirellulaceae bacterium]
MKLSELTWPDVAALSKDTPVVFPVAALEQHGHHMPLFTDSLLCGEVVRRMEERLSERVLFAPLLWLGNSDHHLDFSGTLSAPPRAYLDVLNAMIDNFVMHGFRRLVFINGHGGNHVPGEQTVFEARQRYRQRRNLLLLFGTYWMLGSRPQESMSALVQPQMGHAGEWETSMMLCIRPDLVKDVSNLDAVEFGNPFLPASRGWITKDRTVPGHIGDPCRATAQKGEHLFQLFAEDAVKLLERVLAWDGQSWNG